MATALDLLVQRANEDWIQIWNRQGQLRPDLNAQAIAADAQRARDWLVAQDWSCCDRVWPAETSPKSSLAQQTSPAQQMSPAQPVVLLAAADPAIFLAWFSAVTSLGYPIFLADPNGGSSYWEQITSGLAPELVIADLGWGIPDCFRPDCQLSEANTTDSHQIVAETQRGDVVDIKAG